MSRPWGVHRLYNLIGCGVSAQLPTGEWVSAIPERYQTNTFERIRAAWWVLTGRAEAVVWPEFGDLESALEWQQSLRIEP